MLLIERVKKGATFTAEEVLIDKVTALMVRIYDLRYLTDATKLEEISGSLHHDIIAIRNALEDLSKKEKK